MTKQGTLQRLSAIWVAENHPDDDLPWRLVKLGEEVGELNRAVIAQREGRPDRGDPEREAAQVFLVLLSIADLLDFDLITAGENEYYRVTGDA